MRTLILAAALLAASPALASRCLLVVDDETKLSGPCQIDRGTMSLTVGGGRGLTYFAVIQTDTGEAFWNEERGAGHAHTPLGSVSRTGACWLGRRTRICAWE